MRRANRVAPEMSTPVTGTQHEWYAMNVRVCGGSRHAFCARGDSVRLWTPQMTSRAGIPLGMWRARRDSNPRPSGPKPDALIH